MILSDNGADIQYTFIMKQMQYHVYCWKDITICAILTYFLQVYMIDILARSIGCTNLYLGLLIHIYTIQLAREQFNCCQSALFKQMVQYLHLNPLRDWEYFKQLIFWPNGARLRKFGSLQESQMGFIWWSFFTQWNPNAWQLIWILINNVYSWAQHTQICRWILHIYHGNDYIQNSFGEIFIGIFMNISCNSVTCQVSC